MTAIFNYSESFTSEKLGVATEQCLVFEDSDSGIQSALAAGCKVISVNNQTPTGL
ncbi:HAD family hydrolase [Pseudoalteromonas sp. MSK9-3]|uniref:HAD-IA family hydrolase n=1 Tax=Pseudoalteromonas sp. MSK9-3 TaxID=1897633 RepID=UPI000E6CC1AB